MDTRQSYNAFYRFKKYISAYKRGEKKLPNFPLKIPMVQ